MRYGYRRVHILLQRDGWAVNPKRIYRLYKELGLQLRNKVPRRRVKAKLREDRQPTTQTNETWAMDFVHDQLATGRKIGPDRGRHLLPVLAGRRSALRLSRRGRRRDA